MWCVDERGASVERVVIRPMTVDDLPGMVRSAEAAFRLLPEQVEEPAGSSPSASELGDGDAIVRHLLRIDAAGAWAAVIDGDVVGVAMAGLREGLWYLAQLHLDPVYHGRGLGSRLLQIALDYGVLARGMLLHSSLDPRAMRCYQRAGFALEPALHATGRLRRSSVPPVVGVRAGDVDDLDLVAHIDRVQRGGAHGPDLELLLSLGAQLYVVDNGVRRGYALVHREPKIIAAMDTTTAQALLWTALADAGTDTVGVRVLRADHQWAIDIAVRGGLDLKPIGPLCRRGDTRLLAPICRTLPCSSEPGPSQSPRHGGINGRFALVRNGCR
jgi:GNAT superfamily N-acetyltransferase